MKSYWIWIVGVCGLIAIKSPASAFIIIITAFILDKMFNFSTDARSGNFENNQDMGIVLLAAAIIKCNGNNHTKQLQLLERFLRSNFGQTQASRRIHWLNENWNNPISIKAGTERVMRNTTAADRWETIRFFINIARADGSIDATEAQLIRQIAADFRLNAQRVESMISVYFKQESSNTRYTKNYTSNNNAFAVLGVKDSDTIESIRKTYRKLILKYHPDRNQHLNEGEKKKSMQRYLEIKNAYESVKRQLRFQ